MSVHTLAGQVAPYQYLINVPRLISSYYTRQPDPSNPAHRVAFGTSGHRGSSLNNNFNEAHILAISQAISELRKTRGISGPLYLGMDTRPWDRTFRWRYHNPRVETRRTRYFLGP